MLELVGGHFWEGLGSLFGRVGVTFSSFLGCLGKCLGVVWGCFWIGLGRFGEKCPMGSEN